MSRVKAELDARDVAMVGAEARFVSALVVAGPMARRCSPKGVASATSPGRRVVKRVSAMIRFVLPEGKTELFRIVPRGKSTGYARKAGGAHGLSHRAKAFIRLIEKAGLTKVSHHDLRSGELHHQAPAL